jgi:hypothetical protein
MATFEIIETNTPYYRIRVEFQGNQFEQTIISSKTGAALTTQLQEYADKYEADWVAAPIEGEVLV